jgi:hypothetical protein
MTVTDKQELIINIDGKTKLITRKEIENAFQEPKASCANYERDNLSLLEEFENKYPMISSNNSATTTWDKIPTIKNTEFLEQIQKYSKYYIGVDPFKEQVKDPIVEEVREDLLRRSQLGIAKYGTTLDRTDVDLKGFLTHLYEEILDSANYIKRTIKEIEKDGTTKQDN